MKKDKSGIIYCFNKMCEETDCARHQTHMGDCDNETIYLMDTFTKLDKNGKCKNKKRID